MSVLASVCIAPRANRVSAHIAPTTTPNLSAMHARLRRFSLTQVSAGWLSSVSSTSCFRSRRADSQYLKAHAPESWPREGPVRLWHSESYADFFFPVQMPTRTSREAAGRSGMSTRTTSSGASATLSSTCATCLRAHQPPVFTGRSHKRPRS